MAAPPDPNRRDLLKRAGVAGGVLLAGGLIGAWRYDAGGFDVAKSTKVGQTRDFRVGAEGPADMCIARRGISEAERPTPAALVQRAMDGIGGMRRFISRGDVVVVKPNIGWDRAPVHAANTNPEVVAEIVRLVYDAGAKSVVVTDASCNEANRCFHRSGIWHAVDAVGGKVVLPKEPLFKNMRLKGEVLDDWPIFSPLVNADKVINVPVAKHHNLAVYTGAMKNWYGLLGGRRNRLHQNIDVSIADLATFMQPTLTVLDAVRVLMRNGPQGGNIADAKDLDVVVAGIDQVAVDAFGCTLIGKTPSQVPYLAMGEERGLGTTNLDALRVVTA